MARRTAHWYGWELRVMRAIWPWISLTTLETLKPRFTKSTDQSRVKSMLLHGPELSHYGFDLTGVEFGLSKRLFLLKILLCAAALNRLNGIAWFDSSIA